MSTPYVAFVQFFIGLVLGCLLGIAYGFLRPIRRGRGILPDSIFAVFAGWVFLYYGFAVCRGDLRIGYMAAPILGAIGWDRLFGPWLHPVFVFFWQILAKLCLPIGIFSKKLCNFIKFLFASGKKWGTIK